QTWERPLRILYQSTVLALPRRETVSRQRRSIPAHPLRYHRGSCSLGVSTMESFQRIGTMMTYSIAQFTGSGLPGTKPIVSSALSHPERTSGLSRLQGGDGHGVDGGRFEMRPRIGTRRGLFTGLILGIGLVTFACSKGATEERPESQALKKWLQQTGL